MFRTLGILAHVDAGKTTLSEMLLYRAGALRAAGRVDHKSALMDDHPLEKERGITIFTGEASFELEGDGYYLLDTPGHADFSAEMERALSVLDAAVIVVSCAEGIEAHTRTAYRLLKKRGIPVFFFLNKIDRPGADGESVRAALRRELGANALDFSKGFANEALWESLAEADEGLLEKYLSGAFDEALCRRAAKRLTAAGRIEPAFTGSALRDIGVEGFLNALPSLMPEPALGGADEPFSARVFKITRDAQYGRLAHLRVLSGSLAPRDRVGEEKAGGLFCLRGGKALPIREALPGMLAAVSGLSVKSGETIGGSDAAPAGGIVPVYAARAVAAPDIAPARLIAALRELEDEDPALSVNYRAESGTADLSVMGGVQLEVLSAILLSRFGLKVSFDRPRVLYRETPRRACVGVGHFEPLRHYAEVHLMLLPAPAGTGLQFESRCHVDDLPLKWQQQIRRAVLAEPHPGVLTGAPLTDARAVLLSGRAHLKHSEDGDFREATRRAIRAALMGGESILLEPVYRIEISAPVICAERIFREIVLSAGEARRGAEAGESFAAAGEMPASTLYDFSTNFPALSHGRGSLLSEFSRYAPCHDAEKIVREAAYDPLADTANTPHSVFCEKGAGYLVHWDKVKNFCHLPVETPEEAERRAQS